MEAPGEIYAPLLLLGLYKNDIMMIKDNLTNEKLEKIAGFSKALSDIIFDSNSISSPIDPEVADNVLFNNPMSHYAYLIDRHGLKDLYETFRLMLYSALQRRGQAVKDQLLSEINHVE